MRIVIEIDEGARPKIKVGDSTEKTVADRETIAGATDAGPAPAAGAAPPPNTLQDSDNQSLSAEMAASGFDRNAAISAGAAPGSE